MNNVPVEVWELVDNSVTCGYWSSDIIVDLFQSFKINL